MKQTVRFGSVSDMRSRGLVLSEDKIDRLFFENSGTIERWLRGAKPPQQPETLCEGVIFNPAHASFRNRSWEQPGVIIFGGLQDESFYLVLMYEPGVRVEGGIAPGGPRMQLYFRDGCGREGLEQPLLDLVTGRFENFLNRINN